MASTGPQEDASGATHRTILTLPEECQKEIISHCSQSDLICLSLVCKQFRELAAAEIYRKFHIVFPDEDDHAFESSIDGLAGGLDTFVTSDYDYAKHLKDLSLDTLSAGSKAEAAYKPYLYSVSCGKFMNTLLLLTLRKAKTLETFTWNIRVELSRPVYHALHQIKTLSHLHIRLQAGPSLYETPPALPYPIPPLFEPPVPTSHPSSLGPPPPPPPLPAFGAPPVFYVGTATSVPPPPPPKPPTRTRAPKKSSHSINEPPTLSGFKNLRTLSVLDIDNLDVITEIKKCVRNSSSSLSKLKLSFSDALALQARKPPPDIDPEDSDPDDEFQVVPVPQSSGQNISDDATGPAKAFRAQEERKTQEAVLGRIFDVEPYLVKQGPKPPVRKAETPKEEKSAAPNPGKDFINAIKAVSHRLMKDLNGSTAFDTKQQEILDIIESAARKYVAEEEPKTAQDESNGAEGSSSSAASKTEAPETAAEESAEAKAAGSSSLFKDAAGKGKDVDKEVTPEDIDVEEPEDQLALEPGDAPSASNKETAAASEAASEATPTSQPTPTPPPAASVPEGTIQEPKIHADLSSIEKAVTNLNAQKQNFQTLAEKLLAFGTQANQLNKEIMEHRNGGAPFDVARIREAEQQMNGCSQTIQEIQKEMATVQAEIDDAEKLLPTAITEANSTGTREQTSKRIKDYIRSTRGMALKSLAVYLIPVKASVLCKAVDLRVLQKVTLLNVGPQAPIWMQFAKENRLEPIALRKIFTDNVGSAFLTFVSQLEELHEFFILERDNKYKPESFAPATTITIDHIRRLVLKKHLPTLKRLLIKNMASQEWDMDEKSILLIARKGKNLEELSMSMNISAVHVLSQHIFGLKNLRALHVIQLRNDDTCMWVMRETRRFLIDNLSHYPEMKLEWLSIDDEYRVERIVRPDDPESKKSQKKNKAKGKQKAKASLTNGFNDTFPVLPVDALDGLTDSSDDEDDDSMALKLETIEGLPYYDVWGVKIFKKEVVNGRL